MTNADTPLGSQPLGGASGDASMMGRVEDAIINAIRALSAFRTVDSLGRRGLPSTLAYPAAYIFCAGYKNTGSKPRPIFHTSFEVRIAAKNLLSEKQAAKDIYQLIDLVFFRINGKALGITDIEPFHCDEIEFVDFANGEIEYRLLFTARHYLPVPEED